MREVISLQELKRIARVSKLELSEEELQGFFEDINNVVSRFEKLNDLDLQDISPTSHLSWSEPPFSSDEPRAGEGGEEVLKGAPQVANGYFVVPRVVDKEEKENEDRRV